MESSAASAGWLVRKVDQFRNWDNTCATGAGGRAVVRLNRGWSFRRGEPGGGLPVGPWRPVDLPHSPFVADLDGREHWFGLCEYRRAITVGPLAPGARCALHVGAAMHTATVFLDGVAIGANAGGFLPFEVDLPDAVADGRTHDLMLRLDNRHDPDVPPGKPYEELDFCWYGGLYREVELRIRPPVHITEPVAAGEPAGGGVFVRTLAATEQHATLAVRCHVRNHSPEARDLTVRFELRFAGGIVAAAAAKLPVLNAGGAGHVEAQVEVEAPRLWSPRTPHLHELRASVQAADGTELDARRERIGIRRVAFSRSGGFVINGTRLRLRGTNRHQEFPRAGYAAPAAAQYRDARCIKEAGFDYVRLSHYPQSPAFLDACDELGIVVMNCLPGWQYLGGEKFRAACFDAARAMIRRDRNHPCVVLWELSLNETAMDADFTAALHAIGHEEYPGDQMFTCGWIDSYDVFLRSRQHGEIHTWRNGDKALVVAEYGDWEFFAANDGFDQAAGTGRFAAWSNSRKFRGDGERGLRQQAWNHMVALNDTLASPAVLDGQWSMFDYARGYDPVRAACGVMDVFRLPKFSHHFYRSQRDPHEGGEHWSGGPAVFIASHWLPDSHLRVPVFTNCETVELRLNGELVPAPERRVMAATQSLPHAPVHFELPRFVPGVLEATGYVDGKPRCTHRVATPGPPVALVLHVGDWGVKPPDGDPDLLIVHAMLRDARGTLCVTESRAITFAVEGAARLLGPATLAAEAGIASTVVVVPAEGEPWRLHARVAGARRLTATINRGRGAMTRRDDSPSTRNES